jgi:hypothetical protein
MAATWFYMRGNQRNGPVPIDEMRRLISDGELTGDDLVWAIGMSQWTPAGCVPTLAALIDGNSAPVATAVAIAEPVQMQPAPVPESVQQPLQEYPQQSSLGYYSGTMGMPQRAATTLRGHATPTGDIGDWPINDAHYELLRRAAKLRKKITGAAQLYRALMALTAIATVIIGIAMLVGGLSGPASARMMMGIGGGIAMAVLVGITFLYYFASRATTRSQRWGPLTMFILFVLSVGLNFVSIVISASGRHPEDAVGPILGAILPAMFAVVSWRAFSSIPSYRSFPAWCQELLATLKL